jgi:acetylornithine deacetylase/succinyl-diaminopimelate desuccinylase-like protein
MVERSITSNHLISVEGVYRGIDESFSEHLDRCREFLRQKSISATGEGIPETATLVGEFIKELGGNVLFRGDPSFPIVYGRLDQACKRTLVIYGMYDVQPADEQKWISPPFAAEIHTLPGLGECVVARGAVNSKGALCGLFNVLKVMKETGGIPLNLIFTMEGEEEIGSPHFEEFILNHREELKGDGVVDFDFSQDSKGKVSMHLGLKGIVYMELTCRGGIQGGPTDTALHGSTSAWISSPAWRLIHALSSLTNKKEDIQIPDFYENVVPPNKQEMTILKELAKSFDEKNFLKEMKSLCFKYTRQGVDLLRKGLYSPIININGIRTGYDGPGTKTVLPRKASAKIDIRFGPNMEPEEVIEKFKQHFREQGFDDIEVQVRDSYSWSKTDVSEQIVQHMIRSYRYHGFEPEIWPIATWAAPYFVFSRVLGLPVVSGGLGHGGRQHAANEYMTVMGLKDFEKFAATFLYAVARS